jgi:menaquinone-dependent protoporphyrinogen IX oxidase
MKGIIIYKGKYGATEQYANWLSEELDLPLVAADDISAEKLRIFDFVVLAGSVYIGKWMMRDWLKASLSFLRRKKVFNLIVCGTPASNTGELIKLERNNIPVALYNEAETFFLPGRMIMHKLSWLDRMLLKMGARMQKDPVIRERMLQDVDNVSREHLGDAVKRIKSYQFSRYRSSRVWRYKMESAN